jgi:hypothetical protein
VVEQANMLDDLLVTETRYYTQEADELGKILA